jgi:hypothetical protein
MDESNDQPTPSTSRLPPSKTNPLKLLWKRKNIALDEACLSFLGSTSLLQERLELKTP